MRKLRIVSFWVVFFVLGLQAPVASVASSAPASSAADLDKQLATLNYLLAVDRVQYYANSLADHLQDHEQPVLAQALRRLTPEDLHRQMYPIAELSDPDRWHQILFETLQKLMPETRAFKLKDMQWNYRFYRNKLLKGFKADPVTVKEIEAKVQNPTRAEFVDREVKSMSRETVLLDAGRYAATRTTRGLFWDAALTGKGIELHVGTERDFRHVLQIEGRQVVAEIKTRVPNYNKTYLVFDPRAHTYSYAFTRISGQDRIEHLCLQLRLLGFERKFPLMKGSVRVYGDVRKFQAEQEEVLTKLFKTLPKADQVIIGQKGAVEGLIATAGMMTKLQPEFDQVLPLDQAELKKIAANVASEGSYFAVGNAGSAVRAGFESLENAEAVDYEMIQIEQPSQDIADVLLQTKDGRVVRWRLVSNMWGDEVVPLARALKNSGHTEIVYIGTAGAIQGKGLGVGDVVSPRITYTQEGRQFGLKEATYGTDLIKTEKILGQVRSPFEETATWLRRWEKKIDLVELETGYLREALGETVNFQPYLLISDVVGSANETLADASQNSRKRKSGQMELLESLFLKNAIKKPIARFDVIETNKSFSEMFRRIEAMRPSRDLTSKVQLTHLALRQGLKSNAQIEVLLKSEPAFDQRLLFDRLQSASEALHLFLRNNGEFQGVLAGPEELLNGTWNAKRALTLALMPARTAKPAAMRRWQKDLDDLAKRAGAGLVLRVVPHDPEALAHALVLERESPVFLNRFYEDVILKPKGLVREYDRTGGIRYRAVDDFSRGLRCEAVFL